MFLQSPTVLCVSFCESAPCKPSSDALYDLLVETCIEAGFPQCERLYAGSYFCENYFCALSDVFHDEMRRLCRAYDLGATLVVPLFGQAFFARGESRLLDVLERYDDVYDEVVVNDVALFHYLSDITSKRIGLGRLFSKEQRDARYPDLADKTTIPEFSAEAIACLRALANFSHEGVASVPLVEVDPTSAIVDVTALVTNAACVEQPEIAVHLPLCYATTGRNCSLSSIHAPHNKKFRLGRGCTQECLRLSQGCWTQEGVRYVKHGRTHYYKNPGCALVGVDSWRVVYAAASETMR